MCGPYLHLDSNKKKWHLWDNWKCEKGQILMTLWTILFLKKYIYTTQLFSWGNHCPEDFLKHFLYRFFKHKFFEYDLFLNYLFSFVCDCPLLSLDRKHCFLCISDQLMPPLLYPTGHFFNIFFLLSAFHLLMVVFGLFISFH